jgi:putative hydrolase of the HAD superfamily
VCLETHYRSMKKIVFDFGRVLFHWNPQEHVQRELPQHATDTARTEHWVGEVFQSYGGDWGEFDRGTVQAPELAQRIARRTGLPLPAVESLIRNVPPNMPPIAASVELLARLRRAGHPLYFLSNMPAPYAAYLRREYDFVGWFLDGVFSAEVQHIKPEAAIFHLCTQRFASAPQDLVFLDDHLPNVEMARSLGWNAVHFSTAALAEGEMRAQGWMV